MDSVSRQQAEHQREQKRGDKSAKDDCVCGIYFGHDLLLLVFETLRSIDQAVFLSFFDKNYAAGV